MVDMSVGQEHRANVCRAKRKRPVVQLLQGFLPLEQPAVDQETSGSGFKEVAGARHCSSRAAKPDRYAHRNVSGKVVKISSDFNAWTNKSSSGIALVKCGTLCEERTERMPDRTMSWYASSGNSAWVTMASIVVAPAAANALAQAIRVPPEETTSSTIRVDDRQCGMGP